MKIFLVLLSFAISFSVNAGANNVYDDTTGLSVIHEEKFVKINGIEQWVTIAGEKTKPVILFLHGGPGSPLSPYSENLYKDWEHDFLIVQWDQRGTGKTSGRSAPGELTPAYLEANPLTIGQMTDDGIALSEYLLQYLGKQKVILFGTSWGSALGVRMAIKRPDLFYAYVGHSQIVNPSDDVLLFDKVYRLAEQDHDTVSLKILTELGKPPYGSAKSVGQLLRIVKKYETVNSVAAPGSWFVLSPAYDNAQDEQHRNDGDDYSFVNYIGDKKFKVESMRATINFMKSETDFRIPVYLIQGIADLLTPKESTKKYFDKIKAPKKKYFLLPEAAHGFNKAVLETQYKIFKEIKATKINH